VPTMASYEPYTTEDGKKRVTAVVRIKGFNKTSQAFDTRRDAKEWAEAEERRLRGLRDRGGARADITSLTLADLVTAFLGDAKVQQRRYFPELKQILATWVDEYGSTRIRGFGFLQIVAFRDKQLGTGLSAARVNRYLSAMRRCWNWGNPHYVQTMWPQKIMLEERKPEEINAHYGTSEATVADVHALIAATDARSEALGTLVRFLVGSGVRLSQALAVRWPDIDAKAGSVAIRVGQKGQPPRRVAMLTPALEAVERARTVKHIGGRLFWQFKDRKAMRWDWDCARKTFPENLRKLRLHDCRHLCASFLATQGASHVELAAQLGHSTLVMVKRYAHLAGGHRGTAHDKLDAAFGAPAKK
jgi:integrase